MTDLTRRIRELEKAVQGDAFVYFIGLDGQPFQLTDHGRVNLTAEDVRARSAAAGAVVTVTVVRDVTGC